ncbi:unnamed protein product [Hanseniaspora opuntiae]
MSDLSNSEDEILSNTSSIEDEYQTPDEISSEEEFENENETDKRRRLAKQYLENIREEANEIVNEQLLNKRKLIDSELDDSKQKKVKISNNIDEYNNFDAADLEREILESRLYKDNLSQEGKMYRYLALDFKENIKVIKKQFNRTADFLTSMDLFQENAVTTLLDLENNNIMNSGNKNPFIVTVSKDFVMTKYDISNFDSRIKKVKQIKIGDIKFKPENLQTEHDNNSLEHYKNINHVAISPDGKNIVTGGMDRKLIIWSSETLNPIKGIPTKDRRGEVESMGFRNNSDQLFVACKDYKIRVYNVKQFQQMDTLFGHQGPITDVSVLNMERCVSVGSYDKSLMLWKLQDESRLVFKLPQKVKSQEQLKQDYVKHRKENKIKEDIKDSIVMKDNKLPNFFPSPTTLDLCIMIDDTHFVSSSDDGNIQLWSTQKKKPLFQVPHAHGFMNKNDKIRYSAEEDHLQMKLQADIQHNKHFKITAMANIPYSDLLITGSDSGVLKLWKVDIVNNSIDLVKNIHDVHGRIMSIKVLNINDQKYRLIVCCSKEEKKGRWEKAGHKARNGIYDIVLEKDNK